MREQSFFERFFIRLERAEIDLITLCDAFRQVVDLHLQLALSNLLLAAVIVQLTERIAHFAQVGFALVDGPDLFRPLIREFGQGSFRIGRRSSLLFDRFSRGS